jgi:hypothetical protein
MKRHFLLGLCFLFLIAHNIQAETIYQMPQTQLQTRWFTFENQSGEKGGGGKANFGRKGAPCTGIAVGDTLVLADINESGTIRRIWLTLFKFNPEALRGIKIEIYWDGAKTPAVQAPVGDFFCMSLGQPVAFENAFFSSPEGRSVNCIAPMPFKKGAKIQLINESEQDNVCYYEVDATLGDVHDENMLYFHSYWRRENPTVLRQDYTILPTTKGEGRFIGCNIGMKADERYSNFWWGEGEVKIYLDGDTDYPTLCGTGAEDYIGCGYGMDGFSHSYQGNNFVSKNKDAYGFYRFHIPDPVYFYNDIRVTIQVMGGPGYPAMLEAMDKFTGLKIMKTGDGTEYFTREELEARPEWSKVVERTDDYCSTAYWYMNNPEHNLQKIQSKEERVADLPSLFVNTQ